MLEDLKLCTHINVTPLVLEGSSGRIEPHMRVQEEWCLLLYPRACAIFLFSTYFPRYLGKILHQHNCWSGDSNVLKSPFVEELIFITFYTICSGEFQHKSKSYIFQSYKSSWGTEKTLCLLLYHSKSHSRIFRLVYPYTLRFLIKGDLSSCPCISAGIPIQEQELTNHPSPHLPKPQILKQ